MNHEATEVIDERDLPIFIHSQLDELVLSLEAFRVYAHLARRTNKQSKDAWPSYNSIGEVCFRGSYPNSPKSTLQRMAIAAVKELAHRGLIRVEHRQGSDGSNITNSYYLTPRADWQSNPGASETLPGDKRTPGDVDDGTPSSPEEPPPGAGGTPKGSNRRYFNRRYSNNTHPPPCCCGELFCGKGWTEGESCTFRRRVMLYQNLQEGTEGYR